MFFTWLWIIFFIKSTVSSHNLSIIYLVQNHNCINMSQIGSADSAKILLLSNNNDSICEGAIVFPESTKTGAWNRLFSEMLIRYFTPSMPAHHPFRYIVLVDGGVKINFISLDSSNVKRFWQIYEQFLIKNEPAIGTLVVEDSPVHNRTEIQGIQLYSDAVLAIHVESTPLLLPFADRLDDDYAFAVQNALASAAFGASILQLNALHATTSANRYLAGRDEFDAWARRWIDSAERKEQAPQHTEPDGLTSFSQAQRFRAPAIALRFEPCHPHFFERAQFYREMQHHVPHDTHGGFYLTPEEYAAPHDCRDLIAEDDETAGPYPSVSCNMSALLGDATQLPERIRWRRLPADAGGAAEWRVEVEGCDLGRIDAAGARRCIARASPRGVMLVGDSLTRYLYLNLAHFLATGDWRSPEDLPNENEKRFQNWTHFYQAWVLDRTLRARRNRCAFGGARNRTSYRVEPRGCSVVIDDACRGAFGCELARASFFPCV